MRDIITGQMNSLSSLQAGNLILKRVETVTLKCRNDMANVIVDQFGKDVMMIPVYEVQSN